MDIQTDIYLNQLAQGIFKMDEGLKWFHEKSEHDAQAAILRTLVFFISQSGALGGDGLKAVEASMLSPTFTPCRLLLAAPKQEPLGSRKLKTILENMVHLPKYEHEKTFQLLVALLGIATRRQRKLAYDSEKWWLQDLTDKTVLDKLQSRLPKTPSDAYG